MYAPYAAKFLEYAYLVCIEVRNLMLHSFPAHTEPKSRIVLSLIEAMPYLRSSSIPKVGFHKFIKHAHETRISITMSAVWVDSSVHLIRSFDLKNQLRFPNVIDWLINEVIIIVSTVLMVVVFVKVNRSLQGDKSQLRRWLVFTSICAAAVTLAAPLAIYLNMAVRCPIKIIRS